jgi:hypothetical protein
VESSDVIGAIGILIIGSNLLDGWISPRVLGFERFCMEYMILLYLELDVSDMKLSERPLLYRFIYMLVVLSWTLPNYEIN